jgi:hypothetical protein
MMNFISVPRALIEGAMNFFSGYVRISTFTAAISAAREPSLTFYCTAEKSSP